MNRKVIEMISNYHGHTKHCKHGGGSIREHIESAIAFGLEEVAITEHVPIKNIHISRIDYEDFDKFMQELNLLKVEYAPKIKVLTGLECEYIPEIFADHLQLVEEYQIDFLVIGHHFSNLNQSSSYFFETNSHHMAWEYKEAVIEGIKSGHFKIFGHPDVFLNNMSMDEVLAGYSREILEVCQQYNIVMEINGNGLRNNKGYPNREFWQMAKEYDLQVVINSDSHFPEEIYDHGVIKAYQFASELGIEVTERIEF